MQNNDVVIIGGGVAGLMAGIELASAGKKVLLLEKEDVIMLKSDKSYTTLFLANEQQIVVSKTLKEVEKKFQFPQFLEDHLFC